MDKSLLGHVSKAFLKPAIAVIANNDVLFTVKGGPVLVEAIVSECVTANDATASTLKYQAVPTVGAATDLCGASASLASAAAGATVSAKLDAAATAASLNANGPGPGPTGTMVAPVGTIKAVVAVGSTTGTWRHYIRYRPLMPGAIVE